MLIADISSPFLI